MLTLYHAPKSRSSRIIWLLEEAGAPYEIRLTNIPRMDGSGGPDPANPHPDKKVPALVDDGAQAGIGPVVGDPLRGPYLSWLAYYAGVIEPVANFEFAQLGDHPVLRRTFRGRAEMDARIRDALNRGPYLLGERLSTADILLASLGQFARNMLPADAVVDAYLQRLAARAAFARALQRDDG
jgi:glutathione S-transferase